MGMCDEVAAILKAGKRPVIRVFPSMMATCQSSRVGAVRGSAILTGRADTTGMIEQQEVKGETRLVVSGAAATRDCGSTSAGPVATRTPTRWSTTRWPCSEASMSRGPS
jgi:hypothetical protein